MRLRVTGVVQGVGFRPFVHRLATSLGLQGTVRNDAAGVLIDVFGPAAVVDEFVRRIATDAPPLASVTGVTVVDDDLPVAAMAERFRIIASDDSAAATITALPPDVAVCDECLAEMRDPADRRHRYPFVTCTQCGPRFTITRHLPYDRPNTTMAGFVLCRACQAEYDDPADRRYHAQPLACPACGPQLTLHTADGVVAERDDALRGAQRLIDAGAIVAVKGIGGYHLVCDATNAAAVGTLRARKQRGAKPFAVLVADVAALAGLAAVSATEQRALVSPQRPIVLVRRRAETPAGWSEQVAPGAADVGVMLPSSPVQHLLLDGLGTQVVVCTSGNVADEPIVTDDADALARLSGIADAWLTNDRPIHSACDDSIVRARGAVVVPLRRARGFTPLPVPLVDDGPAVLAMGGDLKGALCLAVGGQAFMSQHLGDHGQLATYRAARQAARQLVDLLRTVPAAVAIDAHPGYLSARLGRELAAEWGVPVVEVQHHHAHVVSVMAEHGVHGPVVGVAFDGTGYGPDGTIWGGEILHATAAGFTRVAHLRPIALPGGDAAIEHPARTALAHLWAAGVEWDQRLPAVAAVPEADRQVLRTQLERGVHTVATSSMGRLFDAVAALAGVRQRVDYEAQAAIELEAVLDPLATGAYAFPPADTSGAVDCAPVIRAVAADALAGTPAATISARFHTALVSHVVHEVSRSVYDTEPGKGAGEGPGEGARAVAGTTVAMEVAGSTVVLSGGVFQNAWLADACEAALVREGCTVLTHRLVPTNDGGLALGQAVVARALLGGNG